MCESLFALARAGRRGRSSGAGLREPFTWKPAQIFSLKGADCQIEFFAKEYWNQRP